MAEIDRSYPDRIRAHTEHVTVTLYRPGQPDSRIVLVTDKGYHVDEVIEAVLAVRDEVNG
jgi:hypothetical protein